jgi:hypothetical protein
MQVLWETLENLTITLPSIGGSIPPPAAWNTTSTLPINNQDFNNPLVQPFLLKGR